MVKRRAYDEEKLEELVLYVADKMKDRPNFGATVLNKVLFFADFFHYAQYGRPITGADYYRLDHGPAPRRLLPVRLSLLNAGRAEMRERTVGTCTQQLLVPLDSPNLSKFSGTEIAVVDEVIEMVSGFTAVDISELTHRFDGWRIAGTRESIPYESIFLHSVPVSDADRAKAKELAALAPAS